MSVFIRSGLSVLSLFALLMLVSPMYAAENTAPSMQGIFSRMNRVTVVKTSDAVFVRTPWNDTQDMLQLMILNTPAVYDNNPVNFASAALIPIATPDSAASAAYSSSIRLSYGSDDACPANYNNGYVGANHGAFYTIKVTTVAAHGKTVEDVGSEWLDGGKRKWYLARIIDDANMWFISENLTPGSIWSFATTITGNKLTHSAKAVHTGDIGISAKLLNQLESMTQIRIYKVLLDGTTEVTADGVYTCKYVDIANTYDISNLASVVDYL
ncbi:MAG: hypothetical protein PHT33_05450, partial [bacterium]|nr:hypothetical protein [bacterium]